LDKHWQRRSIKILCIGTNKVIDILGLSAFIKLRMLTKRLLTDRHSWKFHQFTNMNNLKIILFSARYLDTSDMENISIKSLIFTPHFLSNFLWKFFQNAFRLTLHLWLVVVILFYFNDIVSRLNIFVRLLLIFFTICMHVWQVYLTSWSREWLFSGYFFAVKRGKSRNYFFNKILKSLKVNFDFSKIARNL
jgi:hypothetical protein